jgi:hypothetical protein
MFPMVGSSGKANAFFVNEQERIDGPEMLKGSTFVVLDSGEALQ